MMTQTKLLPTIVILAAIVSLFASLGISSVNAQNMTGNATAGGNMTNATAGGNMTNATAGGNMTNATAGVGNMTSPSPILPPIK